MTREEREGPLIRMLAIAWLVVVAIAVAVRWHDILALKMNDPDDYLRLVQVRDWMGGQSWFDVSQHRFDPPRGGDMHWTRLIDPPLAAGIWLLSPILGMPLAEGFTLALVPLLSLGCAMLCVAYASRGLIGREGALLAALLIPISPSLMNQMGPMRIDHHGWQIAMSGVVLLALARDWRWSGILAGIGAAFWAQISAEAVPYLALIGGILGLRYILDSRRAAQLAHFLIAVTAGSFLFFAAARPFSQWGASHCDAISYPFLLPMLAMTALTLAGQRLPFAASLPGRAACLGVAAALSGALFLSLGRECTAGPFGTLDPLVYRFWYLNVLEGLPLWRQTPTAAVAALWLPLVGAVGTWFGWRTAETHDAKRSWIAIALLLAGATLLAVMVYRAQCVAQLYAIPGAAGLLLALLKRVRAIPGMLVRVPLTAAIIALPSPVPAMFGTAQFDADGERMLATHKPDDLSCATRDGLAGLAKLPPTPLLTPMEIGPALLAFTPHSVLASGYHRNHAAMRELITGFIGSDDNARALMQRHGLRMVAYCQGFPENSHYLHRAPDGFLAHLDAGRAPAWLEPVNVGGSPALRVWRIRPLH